MKILHVFKTYLPDSFTGVERVIWEIAEGASRSGIRSRVFYLSSKIADRPTKIDNHWAYAACKTLDIASNPISFSAFGRFRALAAAADVIHYHFPWPMMDLLHLIARVRTPSVVTYHSDIVRQKHLAKAYAPLMHRFLNDVNCIVATSPNYIESSPVLSAHRAKTIVIPIGLHPSCLVKGKPERITYWRQRLGARFFLFVGAPRYYKGLPFLVEAARSSGLPVVIAGAGLFSAELTRILPQNVIWLGQISDEDKAELLNLCEAFVFPSHLRSEAFGVALLEAAFAGKAMISCEIGTGTSYVNSHNITGLVVPPADVNALAAAMKAIWIDPERTRRLGEAAKQRAHRLFSANDMVEAYSSLYRRLIHKPESRSLAD